MATSVEQPDIVTILQSSEAFSTLGDAELGELQQDVDFFLERLEGLLNVHVLTGLESVDAYLEVVEPCFVETVNHFLADEKSVCRHRCLRFSVRTHDDLVDILVEERFAAKKSNLQNAEPVQGIDSLFKKFVWNGFRVVVVLGTVTAAEIAPPGDDYLRFQKRLLDKYVVEHL